MKDIEFFKRLNEELDDMIPPMSEELRNEPIATDSAPSSSGRLKRFWRKKINRIISVAAAFVLLCVIAAGSVLLSAPEKERYALMRLDINPSVSVVLDKNYRVCGVASNNADADILLQDDDFVTSLQNQTCENAAVLLTERAAKAGFLDVFDEGTKERYNQVTITITGEREVDNAAVQNIGKAVTGYFCERGVYLFAQVNILTDENIRKTVGELTAGKTLFYRRLEQAENLEKYAESAAYGYAETLLASALEKYDLYEKTDALNEAIKDDPENSLRLSYWSVDREKNERIADLCAQMEALLRKMKYLYDLEWSSDVAYSVSRSAYLAGIVGVNIEQLRTLCEEGIGEETFGGLSNIDVRINYFKFVGNDTLQTVFNDLLNGDIGTFEQLADDISYLVTGKAQALFDKYSGLFSLPRSTIGEEDYGAFLARIGK